MEDKTQTGTAHKHTNRLAGETSPYLLQHRHNPVDWYPWGEEAFEKARRENKPLLISIGYSACHWCHVMERESFEDEAIAHIMNETVVAVKVDREERPDVDAIYMEACIALTGQGGWPLNAFVTPELKPFFVGTYFPPDNRYGRPGFGAILQHIARAWSTERLELSAQAAELHSHLQRYAAPSRAGEVDPGVFDRLVNESANAFDLQNGGFGGAPKFPPDQRLAALLIAAHDQKSEAALKMAMRTLDSMACGGMYDQIGGGFARYSVDAEWAIPHFEKMLYNQALLVPVYLDAWLITKSPLYERVARETLDWVLRDMRSPEGVFYSALDADSEGVEGKYYVWTPAQVAEILAGDDARLFCDYYGISDGGNFEHGTSNPHIRISPEEFATRNGMEGGNWLKKLNVLKAQVLAARSKRIPPGTDDKAITGWNALMISAFASGWQVLGEKHYLDAARAAADFLLKHHVTPDGDLLRVFCKGKSRIAGVLDDYAYFAAALVDLYESCFQLSYLEAARQVVMQLCDKFEDRQSGGFYFTSGDDASLISRTKEAHDGALPAGASVAARTLLRLATLFGDEGMRESARRAIATQAARIQQAPGAFAALLIAWRQLSGPIPEIVIAGENHDNINNATLSRAAWQTYLPARVIALAAPESADVLPLTRNRASSDPVAYVCTNYACQAPVNDAAALRKLLT